MGKINGNNNRLKVQFSDRDRGYKNIGIIVMTSITKMKSFAMFIL